MQLRFQTYCSGDSLVHRVDARVKLALYFAYVVATLFLDTWLGLGACAAILVLAVVVSAIPVRRVLALAAPAYVLALVIVVVNAFTPMSMGFERGVFYAARVVLWVLVTLIVTFTTSSHDVTEAFRRFLSPLHHVGVPADDIAAVLSIAVRFIPLTAEEFARIRNAQWSRGAAFDEGPLVERLKTWSSTLVPLLAGLFRRADRLAEAMDARCYGVSAKRTSLSRSSLTAGSVFALVAGLVICVALACML